MYKGCSVKGGLVSYYRMKKLTEMDRVYAIAVAGFASTNCNSEFLTACSRCPPGPIAIFLLFLSSIIFCCQRLDAVFGPEVAGRAMAGAIFFVFFLVLHLPILLGDLYNPLSGRRLLRRLCLASGGLSLPPT